MLQSAGSTLLSHQRTYSTINGNCCMYSIGKTHGTALLTLSHLKVVASSRKRVTSSVIASIGKAAKSEQSVTVSSSAADANIDDDDDDDEDPTATKAAMAPKAWKREA